MGVGINEFGHPPYESMTAYRASKNTPWPMKRSVTIESRTDGSYVLKVQELDTTTGLWKEVDATLHETLDTALVMVPLLLNPT